MGGFACLTSYDVLKLLPINLCDLIYFIVAYEDYLPTNYRVELEPPATYFCTEWDIIHDGIETGNSPIEFSLQLVSLSPILGVRGKQLTISILNIDRMLAL